MDNTLIDMMNKHGKPQTDASAERILQQEHDTFIVKAGEPLTGGQLFTTAFANKLKRSNSLPFPYGRIATLIALGIEHNVRYVDANTQKAFEAFSTIKVSIESKEYSPTPIAQHIGYKRVERVTINQENTGTDAAPVWATKSRTIESESVATNMNGVPALLEPLDLPHAGSMEMLFVNAVANQPTDPNGGLSGKVVREMFGTEGIDENAKYYFVRFNYVTRMVRQIK